MASMVSNNDPDDGAFAAGVRVRIVGIQARPELNGTVSVVKRYLPDKQRYMVIGFPKPLLLKASNLRAIPTSDRTDWTFLDDPPTAIHDVISNPRSPVYHLDRCDQFSSTLMRFVTQGGPTGRRQIFLREHVLPTMIGNAGIRHSIYFLALDQISHHCVLEVYEGKARLYQSYIKDVRTVDDGGALGVQGVQTGYTAGEWASPSPPRDWPDATTAAHARWGGGKELTFGELEELLDLMFRLQDVTTEIALEVQRQVPGGRDESTADLLKPISAQSDLESIYRIQDWTVEALARPDASNMVLIDGGGVMVRSTAVYTGAEPYSILIPAELEVPYRELMLSLTGQSPGSTEYLRALNYIRWRTSTDPQPGQEGSAIGWAMTAVGVPH